MRQHLLTFFIAILTLQIGFSQALLSIDRLTIQENFSGDLTDPLLEFEVKADLMNVSGDTLILRWERQVIEQPMEWQTLVCLEICYDPEVSTNIDAEVGINEPLVIPPDSIQPLILYVVPNGIEGIGKYELSFAQSSAPDDILQNMSFDITVGNATSVSAAERQQLKVFPNPSIDYFEISQQDFVEYVTVFNLVGRAVKSFSTRGATTRFPINDLPEGMYMVSMQGRDGDIIKTVRLLKRSFRP